jgi:hypothetical protein
MKIFLLKVLLFLVLIFGLSLLLKWWVYDPIMPYEANNVQVKKFNEAVRGSNYNMLFIGSSKTAFQIDPFYFDSLVEVLSSQKIQTNSFTYGVTGMLVAESFFVLDQLLSSTDLNQCKYIVMELNTVPNPKIANLNKKRSFYYLSTPYYFKTLSILSQSVRPIHHKLWSLSAYTVNYIDDKINLSRVRDVNNYICGIDDKIIVEEAEGSGGTGEEQTVSRDVAKYRGYTPEAISKKRTKKDFEAVSSELNSLKNASLKYFSEPPAYVNQSLLEAANGFIERAKQKNIHLIFLMTPQWREYQYVEMVPVFNQLPNAHKILIGDARKYPELYSAEISLDPAHLDIKGSKIYTQILSKEVYQIIK